MSLLENTDKIHTTQMGVGRIKKNAKISRKGKNYYIEADGCIITVNASSYTIITAHLK